MYRLEVPKSWCSPPLEVFENNGHKIRWDFKFHIEKPLLANQSDTAVADKEQKMAVVIDVAIKADSKIRQKEQKKIDKYQQQATGNVGPVLIEALVVSRLKIWDLSPEACSPMTC